MKSEGMTEAEFQKQITDLCDWLHLKWHHETDSRKSKSGFPDLVIAGKGGVIFAELKVKRNKASAAQKDWLRALDSAGVEWHVWYPEHFPYIKRRLQLLAQGRVHTVKP